MLKFLSSIAILVLLIGLVPSASAQLGQENYCNEAISMVYGDSVSGQITNANFVAIYCFNGNANESINVNLSVTNGTLDPLILISDPAIEDIYVNSLETTQSNPRSLSLDFTLPSTGQYLIAVSRVGVDEGTTTGGFSLSLSGGSARPQPTGEEFSINVTCTEAGRTTQEVRGGIQFSFINVNPGYSYTATVFGLDDFDPVLAVEHGEGIGTCNDDSPAASGSELAVPGYGYVQANNLTSQVRFSTARQGDPVNITVGAYGGGSGQFVLIIEGLAISPSDELDGFVIRVPSSLAMEPLGVYIVSRYTDLDTVMELWQGEGLNQAFDSAGNFYPESIDYNNLSVILECDDAGAGTCADTPAFPSSGTGVVISNGSSYIAGSTDSGLIVTPNSSDPMLFVFGSYNSASSGPYAIMVIGNVPGE